MSGLVESDLMNVLIIDPQNDFHEGGNLEVPGAIGDSGRISDFLTIKKDQLNKVFVSLDTHTHHHIGHAGYWKLATEDSNGPFDEVFFTPFTLFSVDDENIYVTKEGVNDVEVEPRLTDLKTWTLNYISALNKRDNPKGRPLIWPEHCIEMENGHKVHEKLKGALDALHQSKVEYHIKGQNEAAEMYSIFKAEIPVPRDTDIALCYHGAFANNGEFKDKIKLSSKIDIPGSDEPDGVYLNTEFNQELYHSLTSDGHPIVICGEALSHCVNWSLRDLVDKLIEDGKPEYVEDGKIKPGKIILFRNGSSPVRNFTEPNVVDLEKYCEEKGVSIKDFVEGEFQDSQSATARGGKRKSKKIQKKRKNTQKRNKKRRTIKK